MMNQLPKGQFLSMRSTIPRRVTAEFDPETGDWAAWCLELPGCASAGETKEAALENIREAIELYLEPDL